MKININYDLMEKIVEAKKGIRLQQINRESLLILALGSPVVFLFHHNLSDILKTFVNTGVIAYTSRLSSNLILSPMIKDMAKRDLIVLSLMLTEINVNTTGESLLDSYKYKTEYEVKRNEKNLPILEQRKYIMVPTEDANGEVSLLQEHIIGTKDYSLSYGSPKKVLKLVPNLSN